MNKQQFINDLLACCPRDIIQYPGYTLECDSCGCDYFVEIFHDFDELIPGTDSTSIRVELTWNDETFLCHVIYKNAYKLTINYIPVVNEQIYLEQYTNYEQLKKEHDIQVWLARLFIVLLIICVIVGIMNW